PRPTTGSQLAAGAPPAPRPLVNQPRPQQSPAPAPAAGPNWRPVIWIAIGVTAVILLVVLFTNL
ncbi:hypothetical protein, partial [Cumulibacter manganitolerans]|uniref:hypothetical protein n=1 Tax=Cumulibacter manganitolerans TaxID=1884992 RepID=UPI001E485132